MLMPKRLLEGFFPAIVCGTIYFISPESPRYLVLKGRRAEAAMVIARYHTTEGNNPDHPLVKAVVQQMEDSVAGATNTEVWDWRGFFKKGARSRVGVLIIYSIFQSWNGGGIIGQVGHILLIVPISERTESGSWKTDRKSKLIF
jgi:hypothetical protein